mmetsp:Transcript_45911/g.120372  ORF Transcript_45911/g.120372 Transcript_45911/m.120372 type:complete len:204 (+) Transcript_45911:845-1456(+)
MLMRWPEAWAASRTAPRRAVSMARGAVVQPPIVTELRDIFHTIVDIAGLADATAQLPPAFDASDGKSMLCLLTDPSGSQCDYAPNPGPWRAWIDLEHSTCYNETNHWSALTDGRLKYVYRAWDGGDQLFNLTQDPYEATDLAVLPEYADVVAHWRRRMVDQFEAEGRGPDWVQHAQLMVRPNGQTYSPNYPQQPHTSSQALRS